MSTSPSNTPPVNPIPHNTSPSLSESITTSRPSANDDSTTEFTVKRDQNSISRPITHSLSPPSSANTSPTQTHHPDDVSFQQDEMANQMKEESPETRDPASARSSPSTDSQGGTVDTETELRQDERRPEQYDEPPAAVTQPTKKKRTRTLTTPHQSAVLHALLAKSRFPTTAMREEVGRSIGLSARKVQIWFQNQRQKARRPKPQAENSRSRGAQYGPFPNAPESSSSVGSFPIITDQNSISLLPPHHHLMQQSSEGYGNIVDGHGHLLGPGVPGVEAYATALFRARPFTSPSASLPPPRTLEPRRFSAGPSSARVSPAPGYHGYSSRPSSSHDAASMFSRTLPPLQFSSVSPGPSTSPSHTHSSSGMLSGRPRSQQQSNFARGPVSATHLDHPQLQFYRAPSPEADFAYRLPDPTLPPLPPLRLSTNLNIPPPFALQPEPQWDNSVFNPVPRPNPSWSRPTSRSAKDGTPSPVTLRRESASISLLPTPGSLSADSYPPVPRNQSHPYRPPTEGLNPRAESPPKAGRFDPIREALQQLSSPATGTPPPPSPTPRSDLDDRNLSQQD